MANIDELIGFYNLGKIDPHIHKIFPMEETAQALNCLSERTVLGKVIVSMQCENPLQVIATITNHVVHVEAAYHGQPGMLFFAA